MKSSADLNAEGARYQLRGDFDAAKLHYLAALTIDPNNYQAVANLTWIFSQDAKTLETALAWGRRYMSMVPMAGAAYYNVGNVLMQLHRMTEAEECLRVARQLAPEDPITWYNSAINAFKDRKSAQALMWLEEAMRLDPNCEGMKNDRAFMLLDLGIVAEGLVDYENRWNTLVHVDPWDLHLPEWQGGDLSGRHILVHSEQGFGDAFMLARFVPIIAARCKVTFAVPKVAVPLFEAQEWTNVDIIALDRVLDDAEDRKYNIHSPMFSAWRWLGISVGDIESKPYLRLPKSDLPRLKRKSITFHDPGGTHGFRQDGLNVGICWASGRYGGIHGALRRVVDLELFLPLAAIPGVTLYSLQMGGDEVDLERLQTQGIVEDPTPTFHDWACTASFVKQLDLVVCAETAVGHLAGAMGVPTIILSPYRNCWRWWNIDIDQSGKPWYDNMKVFRQPTPFDWKQPLRLVENHIEQLSQSLRRAA